MRAAALTRVAPRASLYARRIWSSCALVGAARAFGSVELRLASNCGLLASRRSLSQMAVDSAATEAVAVDETAAAVVEEESGTTELSVPEGRLSTKRARTMMLKAARDKNYTEVLSVYEAMVDADLAPTMEIFNLIVEAKAQTVGIQEALQTMEVLRSTAVEDRVG